MPRSSESQKWYTFFVCDNPDSAETKLNQLKKDGYKVIIKKKLQKVGATQEKSYRWLVRAYFPCVIAKAHTNKRFQQPTFKDINEII